MIFSVLHFPRSHPLQTLKWYIWNAVTSSRVAHQSSSGGYRSPVDWCSGSLLIYDPPILDVTWRRDQRASNTFPPTWLHIDLPSCNYTGVNSRSVDQHAGVGSDRGRAQRNGDGRSQQRRETQGWQSRVDGACRISNPAFLFSSACCCSSDSYGYLKGVVVLDPGGFWCGETRADLGFTMKKQKQMFGPI